MTPIVIDADAVHCLRSFGLLDGLERFVAANQLTPEPLLCMGCVARRELNPIQDEVKRLEALGVLKVSEVLARSPTSVQLRQLRERHRGIDKGEAEAIAWLVTTGLRLPFVSCDVRAREIARAERITAWDVLDLVHEWIAASVLSLDAASDRLVDWSDDRGARWRPRDFVGVEATLRQRYGQGFLLLFDARRGRGTAPDQLADSATAATRA